MDGESSSTVTVVSVTTSQNVFTSNRAISDQSGQAAPSSSETAVAVITGTPTELPPTYKESEATIQTPADAVGEHNLFTGHASDRAAIYDALYEGSKIGGGRADRQTGRYVQLQEGHSNGWYDGCFTRSCVCDYTGRHVIPEYITSGSLHHGRVLGWKIFREMTLPIVGNALRICWTLLQLVLAVALLILSSVNYAGGRRSIYNIVHLTLSVIAVLLASFDFGGSIINKILRCRSSNTYTRMNNIGSSESLADENEQSAAAINTTDALTRETRSCVSDGVSKFSYVDIARLIIPEVLLFPIVICDVYMFMNEDVYRLETNNYLDWVSFVELLFSVCTLVILVYFVRITVLGVMTYRVHTKRAPPKELHFTQEAIIGAGCDPKIRRNGLIYLLFLIFNVVTHIVNQIAMILAIGLKVHEYIADDSSHFLGYHNGSENPNKFPFNFWFMIAAGYVLPIAGAWLFFSVTHFWLQEFAIGIAVDYLGMLKLPGAACLFFPEHSPYEARNRANEILSHNKYDRLRQDYHALQNENPLAKAFYPFKNFIHTLMCLGYTVVQVIFVYVTAFSIQGKQLNMGIFLFVIITELLSNVYILLVALFWIIVGVAILTTILLVLGLSVKCIICVAIFCSSYLDSLNRGPPQPPVMTPQIRMGLQQV